MIFAPFIIALGLSLFLTPLVRFLSTRFGKVVDPRNERWHKHPTPTSGGIAIFIAFLIATLVLPSADISVWGLLIGAGIAFALGLVDDIVSISPPVKLLGQIIAAAIIVLAGNVTAFFSSEIANIFITFFWLVAMSNALNLLDNMDGLSAGTTLVVSSFLAYFFYQGGNSELLPLALALGGATLGFFIFNFPPASIFMGDSGSLFLGITLAGLAVAREPQASNVLAILGVPILILLLPIMDTAMVSLTRLLRGQSPAVGGKDHLSHRLVSLGFSERQVLLLLLGISLISGISAVLLESYSYSLSLILIPAVVLILALFAAFLGQIKLEQSTSEGKMNMAVSTLMGISRRFHVIEIVLDFLLIAFSYFSAFSLRFGVPLSAANVRLFSSSLPLVLATSLLVFVAMRIYQGLWKYLSIRDLIRLAQAALFASIGTVFILLLVFRFDGFSRQVFLIYPALLFALLTLSRFSFRLLDSVFAKTGSAQGIPVLIYGAGDAGELALREIARNKQLNYRVVGFIDDNEKIHGREIHGITVIGDLADLGKLIEASGAQGIIISSRKILVDEAHNLANHLGNSPQVWVRKLRIEFEEISRSGLV